MSEQTENKVKMNSSLEARADVAVGASIGAAAGVIGAVYPEAFTHFLEGCGTGIAFGAALTMGEIAIHGLESLAYLFPYPGMEDDIEERIKKSERSKFRNSIIKGVAAGVAGAAIGGYNFGVLGAIAGGVSGAATPIGLQYFDGKSVLGRTFLASVATLPIAYAVSRFL